MKKSKGKWTKKRGGFFGFSVPDFGISSFFGYTKPDTPAVTNPNLSGTTSVAPIQASGTQSSGAKQATQSSGANQATNTVGGSRRKRKTKKSKK